MKKILFMGDSITDCGRSRDSDYSLGYGYATLVSASIGLDKPNEYTFQNKGISGNRIIDLLSRVKCDMINLSPDYMSILIGVNDVWHELGNGKNGVDNELFEVYYDMLIRQLKKAMPNVKIMILEPFVRKGNGTEQFWDEFRSEVEKRAETAKKIAKKYNLCFVPLMKKFDDASEIAPDTHWTHDGVHPTNAGHEIIKRAWIEAFESELSK